MDLVLIHRIVAGDLCHLSVRSFDPCLDISGVFPEKFLYCLYIILLEHLDGITYIPLLLPFFHEMITF